MVNLYRINGPVTEEEWKKFEQARRKLARALQPFFNEYRTLVKKLRVEGFRISSYTFMAPIQLRGHLPSGEAFYFRCRHETCRLQIAPARSNPVTESIWENSVSRWDHREEASALNAAEAEAVLRELIGHYSKHRP